LTVGNASIAPSRRRFLAGATAAGVVLPIAEARLAAASEHHASGMMAVVRIQ
jgi:hypothetical protein